MGYPVRKVSTNSANVQNIDRIYALSKRNVILRYKNSLAGFLWGFIKPLLYLIILIIVFGQRASIEKYELYAASGLIFWFFFSNSTSQSVGSIIGSSGLIKALNIPSYFFPLSEILGELFNLLLTLIVFLVLMHWAGLVYDLRLLLAIPCALLFAIFVYGLNLLLCSINVFFRDIGIIWGTIQPALFFLTPIAYPENDINARYRIFIENNPIYFFIKLGRSIFYNTELPSAQLWITCTAIAFTMFLIGQFVFNRLKNQFISAI